MFNLRRLYETETLSSEPILLVISPGVDPSQVHTYVCTIIIIDRLNNIRT